MSGKCESKTGLNDNVNPTEKGNKNNCENLTKTEDEVEDEKGLKNSTGDKLQQSSEASTTISSRNFKYNIFRRGRSLHSIEKNKNTDVQSGEKSEPEKARIMTQSQFRRGLKISKDRLLHDEDGKCFRFVETPMNGDCGFAAIAKSSNISNGFLTDEKENLKTISKKSSNRRLFIPMRSTKKGISQEQESKNESSDEMEEEKFMKPEDVRSAMSVQILKEKSKYLLDKEKYGCYYTEADYDRLLNDVIKSGISGHWLGSILGNMEHVILSHALKISIFLYQFDLQKQVVRKFEDAKVDNPRHQVFLLFTGPGTSGHFDALILVP